MTLDPWTRITVLQLEFDVTATEANDDPATIAGVDCAILPHRTGPSSTTTWKAATWMPPAGGTPGFARLIIAGPDATDPGSSGFRLPAEGADLWARVTDNPEVHPWKVVQLDMLRD